MGCEKICQRHNSEHVNKMKPFRHENECTGAITLSNVKYSTRQKELGTYSRNERIVKQNLGKDS